MSWLGWSLEQWNTVGTSAGAAGTVATTVIAGLAARFAFHQVKEARELREAQAQPYVVVYIAPSRASSMYLDLIVRNIGHTVARDVKITIDPPLRSTLALDGKSLADVYFLKEGIPSLPPEMEYRVVFESGPHLYENKDLPRQYRASVQYRSERGQLATEEYVLDLETFFGYRILTVYGEHDSAVALRDISRSVKRWTTHGDGLKVYGRDEDALQREWAKMADEPDSDLPDTDVIKVESLDSDFQGDL